MSSEKTTKDRTHPPGESMRWTAVRLNAKDNVATALSDLAAGEQPRIAELDAGPTLVENIARGHKLALVDITAGATVIKFGQPIGIATRPIAAGAHVHLHNLEGLAGRAARQKGPR